MQASSKELVQEFTEQEQELLKALVRVVIQKTKKGYENE